ncbi:hypothetical protein ACFOHP_33880 [Couchioplanes caeruleus subsp. azureus]|uniref:hypothetical protein n=1 Tax=Couchioplanes caeruleus TaxID=56438 RepID=UPI001F1B0D2B|nr:hypothetical protein [Couchioplanes caeruleus]
MTAKTRAEEIAEKAARLAARKNPAADTTHAAPPPAAEAPLAKPVRTTLDLSPARNRDFQAWLAEAAVRLGRARVTKQEALNALVGRVLSDEVLTKLILDDLRKDQ